MHIHRTFLETLTMLDIHLLLPPQGSFPCASEGAKGYRRLWRAESSHSSLVPNISGTSQPLEVLNISADKSPGEHRISWDYTHAPEPVTKQFVDTTGTTAMHVKEYWRISQFNQVLNPAITASHPTV